MRIATGLSLMPGDDFRVAAAPLFNDGLVEVVEWSFDMGWGQPLSPWLICILDSFSARNALLGHGVSYSVLDASQTNRPRVWLNRLQDEITRYSYRQLSVHFGFMGGGNFHFSAPLPVPRSDAAVAVGRERMGELAAVAKLPVGLENLAFAFGLNDVEEQGAFLDELLEPVGRYPLDRVRELHVSGGSWSEHPAGGGNQVRRDTHDGPVPDEIFAVLPEILRMCGKVETVIFERMDGTIDVDNSDDINTFRNDFMRLRKIVKECDR